MSQLRIRRQPTRVMIVRTWLAFWGFLIADVALSCGVVWVGLEILKAWGWL